MIKIQGNTRNILLVVGTVLILFLIWYFWAIVSYILISAVLSLVGRPLVRFIQGVKLGRFHFSKGLAAFLALVLMWVLFIGFFSFLIPLVMNEFQELSGVNLKLVINEIEEPVEKVMTFLGFQPVEMENRNFLDIIKSQLGDKIGFAQLTNVFAFIAGAVGKLLVAFFSVSFITYFFLSEEDLFKKIVLAFVPLSYEKRASKIFASVYVLLKRYFIGLLAEVFMVGLLVSMGMVIVGIGFSHAVVIGLFCALFNIIPYLGPWMGALMGLFIGIAVNVHADFMSYTFPLLGLMIIVFILVQLLDNVLFQPLIYSSSVKAHPLEIFLVIMIAGTMAGVAGMILAIPVYTILRVVAKEFMDNLKIVRALTRNLR